MVKTKKNRRARPAQAPEAEILPPPHGHKPKSQQQTLTSVPAKIVDEARKASHHIIDTLAKTALAISSAENAAEKLNVIQSLWNMQKEAEDRQAEREFNVAKVNVAMELPPIPKTKVRAFLDKNNVEQRSTYADLDDIESVLDPICRKYGIVKEYSTRTDARGWAAQVCTVRHVSGHKEVYEGSYMPLDTSGSKNNNQAALSTAKYSRRGALIGAFNIFHIDEDLDGALPEEGPKADKFAERVQAQAEKPTTAASPHAMTLPEAAGALESKIRNATPDKRAAILVKNINIIDAMEKEAAWHEKAAELRQLCIDAPQAVEEGQ